MAKVEKSIIQKFVNFFAWSFVVLGLLGSLFFGFLISRTLPGYEPFLIPYLIASGVIFGCGLILLFINFIKDLTKRD